HCGTQFGFCYVYHVSNEPGICDEAHRHFTSFFYRDTVACWFEFVRTEQVSMWLSGKVIRLRAVRRITTIHLDTDDSDIVLTNLTHLFCGHECTSNTHNQTTASNRDSY